jgi:anthranilate synthase
VTAGELSYRTASGVTVRRSAEPADPGTAIDELAACLDTQRGVLLTSDYEYPNRYTRRCRGFCSPPLAVTARGRQLRVEALNERGTVLLDAAADLLAGCPDLSPRTRTGRRAEFTVVSDDRWLTEEQRTRRPSAFSALRALVNGLSGPDELLGLYGAFGYDLVFQFDTLTQLHPRDPGQPDLVLYLPDEIVVPDRGAGHRYRYEFAYRGRSTSGLSTRPFPTNQTQPPRRRRAPGDVTYVGEAAEETLGREDGGLTYAEGVERAKDAFRRGDLFEVVLTKTFRKPATSPPSAVFARLRQRNPAPYGALVNLGGGEFLVSGSPEMFVRVSGRRVETCPISGTTSRGGDALEDSELIRALLNSAKDESELTMCTDVDRNDKARVCVPGSVRVIGRRQIEAYSRVIHTVDHIEGTLHPGFDGIDAFLTHMWAVTVTGAPKLWAMRFIEEHEADPRLWYGGAIGYLGFDGDVDTGLTLRTVRIKGRQAEVRVGGTLLHESVPHAEEKEVRMKAAAFLDALDGDAPARADGVEAGPSIPGARVLLLDCEDSFVHTLSDYVRRAGAEVQVIRMPLPLAELAERIAQYDPGLLLISPGPGRPGDFRLDEAIGLAVARGLPVFGVCLGFQGIVEYFGGRLGLLPEPVHGKASLIVNRGGRFFDDGTAEFTAGRYHSIFVRLDELPPELVATGWTREGVVMQVEHRTLPIAAVQFHPESIMSAGAGRGMRLLRVVLSRLLVAAHAPAGTR